MSTNPEVATFNGYNPVPESDALPLTSLERDEIHEAITKARAKVALVADAPGPVEKADRQLLRELFYARLPHGPKLEEMLLDWRLDDLHREVYARLERPV